MAQNGFDRNLLGLRKRILIMSRYRVICIDTVEWVSISSGGERHGAGVY